MLDCAKFVEGFQSMPEIESTNEFEDVSQASIAGALSSRSVETVKVYTRHKRTCPKRDRPDWARCNCVKWLYVYRNGKDTLTSAKTRSWEKAEQRARELRDSFDPIRQLQRQLEAKIDGRNLQVEVASAVDHFTTVLDSVAQLSQHQIRSIFASDIAAQSCRFVLDRFWSQEADKKSPQWPTLMARLGEIESTARKIDATILLAAVTRARIVITTPGTTSLWRCASAMWPKRSMA